LGGLGGWGGGGGGGGWVRGCGRGWGVGGLPRPLCAKDGVGPRRRGRPHGNQDKKVYDTLAASGSRGGTRAHATFGDSLQPHHWHPPQDNSQGHTNLHLQWAERESRPRDNEPTIKIAQATKRTQCHRLASSRSRAQRNRPTKPRVQTARQACELEVRSMGTRRRSQQHGPK